MKVELLAPGGSYESVIAAYNAGADAVYTGGEFFGARAGAENLTTEQFTDVLEYAHLHGKKLYLTINTLLKDSELNNQLHDYLNPLYKAGLDAVIVQDFGVMKFVKEHFPKLSIHASTQMTVMGKDTSSFLEKYGVKRVVTPREFSLEEIQDIRDNTNLEIESFVHGALCYCYSGQCLMSSFIGGRSGNRGRCAQPCRMEYQVLKNGHIINDNNEKYILSPKDICCVKIIPEIIESGVTSLKIEGRMKKVEYIAGVVSIYRKYIDLYYKNPKGYKVSEKDMRDLQDLFNRNGFSESYYKMHNGRSMISLKKVDFRKENEQLTDRIRTQYLGKQLKVPIHISVEIRKDHPIKMYTMIGENEVSVIGQIPQTAETKPIDAGSIEKQVRKLGNTDFVANQVTIILEDNLFVTIREINKLRRNLIELIRREILSKHERVGEKKQSNYDSLKEKNSNTDTSVDEKDNNELKINCQVWNKKQFDIVLHNENINTIYIEVTQFAPEELKSFMQTTHNNNKKLYLALPYVFRKKDKEYFEKKYLKYIENADGILLRNIEQYFYLKNFNMEFSFIFDYNVYTVNSEAKQFAKIMSAGTTVSVELNRYELDKFNLQSSELIVYGRLPVMISAGCALKTLRRCEHTESEYLIKDRLNYKFPVKCICDYCYNVMFNSLPVSIFQYADAVQKLNPKSIRLIFTTENENEVFKILEMAKEAFIENKNTMDMKNTTRGHFLRGVR